MSRRMEIPFDSVENAHEYIRLLAETVAASKHDIATVAKAGMSDRRIQALRIVEYNLEKLERYLTMSGRTLNDLRSLRRLLFEERSSAKGSKMDTRALLDSQSPAPSPGITSAPESIRGKAVQAVATSRA